MHEPCRVAQSLPTPDTIMLRTARCSACCDRRGDQGGDRSRPHAAARRGIEPIRPNIFDGGNAEGVDRRLGDDEARKSRPLWRQTEQRFRAAGQRALVGRFAYVDMRDSSRVIAPAPPADREAVALQGRAGRARAFATDPCGAAGASGSGLAVSPAWIGRGGSIAPPASADTTRAATRRGPITHDWRELFGKDRRQRR